MRTSERQSRISAYLSERGYASLNDLVQQFGVSLSTLRRDLEDMQRTGCVRRTHGGAFHVEARRHSLDFEVRADLARTEKLAIGALAASFVRDGEAILLDGGTTTYAVAERLVGRRIQVVTSSLPVAGLLGRHSETEVVFLGGSILPATGVALGRWAEAMLRSLHVSRAVMGVAGVTADGLFNANLLLVELQRLMIEAAEEVMIVVDHCKFGRRSLVKLSDLREIDRLVTDSGLEARWLEVLRGQGIDVAVAEVPAIAAESSTGNGAARTGEQG